MVKKINAILSLISIALLFVHAVYHTVSYLLYYYNPLVTKLLGYILFALILTHAVLSVIVVFILHDSKKISYPRNNIKTILQRISGFSLLLIIFTHIRHFAILDSYVGSSGFTVALIVEIVFFGLIFLHIALSFSKAFISLGLITSMKSAKICDITVSVICAACFVIMSIIITTTHINIFGG